jgi:hypothetical protein
MIDPLSPVTDHPSFDPAGGWIARRLPQAQCKLSDLSFRMGGVGMRLISKTVAVDTQAVGQAILEGRHRKAHLQFSQEMDVAMTRLLLLDPHDHGQALPFPMAGSAGRGLRAYLAQNPHAPSMRTESGFSAIV